MTTIAFLVRDDFFDKFGGDTYQIEQYRKNFVDITADILTYNDFDKSRNYDLYILTNVDRMSDYIGFYSLLRKRKLMNKTMILPIHHSYESISKYISFRYGKKGDLINFFGGVFFLEKLKGIFRNIRENRFLYMMKNISLSYKNIIKESIENSLGIIYIANGEMKNLVKDYGLDENCCSEYSVIRNGISQYFVDKINMISCDKSSVKISRDIDIIICGRIEPRKNQLSILKKLIDSKLTIRFIGDINRNNTKYCNEFLSLIGSTENDIKYLGKVTPDEMFDYYLRSKICLSASWFEVSSLVDIEAFAAGCEVLPSSEGHSQELLSPYCLVSPIDMDKMELDVNKCIGEINAQKIIRKSKSNIISWKESSLDLENYILQVLNKGAF